MSPNRLASFLGQRVGFKSGLALSRSELAEQVGIQSDLRPLIGDYSDVPVRLYSDDIKEGFQRILFGLGVIRQPWLGDPPTLFHLKYDQHPKLGKVLNKVHSLLGDFHFSKGRVALADNFDEEGYFDLVTKFGDPDASKIARDLVDAIHEYERSLPWDWFNAREREWEDTLELRELFDSEKVEASCGNFFDARFIGYLARNFGKIDEINWRKFEALTAEYFTLLGYSVEVGTGRNDGGVDLRIWKETPSLGSPPLIIVQCKRVKRRVEKVVVKSLWADLVEEDAKIGLIVTTAGISPGSKAVISKRDYPIAVAERKHVESWVRELHKPGRGVYLGT